VYDPKLLVKVTKYLKVIANVPLSEIEVPVSRLRAGADRSFRHSPVQRAFDSGCQHPAFHDSDRTVAQSAADFHFS